MLRRIGIAVSTLAVPAVVGGCYTFMPMDADDVPPSTTVRVHVSPAGFEEHSGPMRPRNGGGELEGDLLEVNPDDLLVQVPVVAPDGRRGRTLHERVRVSRDHVVVVERREMNRARLAASLGAGGLVAGFVLWRVVGGGTGGEGPDPPPGGPVESPPTRW